MSDCDGLGRSPVLFACGGMYACVFAVALCVCACVTGVASAFLFVLCVWPFFCCPSRCHCFFFWLFCGTSVPFFLVGFFGEVFSCATHCLLLLVLLERLSLSCGFPLHFFPAGTFFFFWGTVLLVPGFALLLPASHPYLLLCCAVLFFSSLAFRSSALN